MGNYFGVSALKVEYQNTGVVGYQARIETGPEQPTTAAKTTQQCHSGHRGGTASSTTTRTPDASYHQVQAHVATSTNASTAQKGTQPSDAKKRPSRSSSKHFSQKPVTPISPHALKKHLTKIGYDKSITNYLVQGFTEGFRLDHNTSVTSTEPTNDISIETHADIAYQKISKEVEAGRMKGPFTNPPFPDFHVSPIKLTEKSVKGTFRMIHNLSWPYDETSINSQISDDSKTVKYSNVNEAIKLVMQFPKGSYTRKTDIQNAFKLIPIHPDDHSKLGIKFQGKYY